MRVRECDKRSELGVWFRMCASMSHEPSSVSDGALDFNGVVSSGCPHVKVIVNEN